MPRSSIPRSCSSRPPTPGAAARNPDASAQGAPLFDQMLAAYAAFADSDPGAHAEGDTGLERHRGESPGRQGAAGRRRLRQAEAYQAYARQRGEAAVAGASDTLARVIPGGGGGVGAGGGAGRADPAGVPARHPASAEQAGAHFDRIADGDLTGAIALRGDNEIGVLYSAMRRMQASLTERWPRCATASRKSIPARARSPRAAPTCPTAPRAGRLIAGSGPPT